MMDSMVDSLIGSASQKRVHSKPQNWVHSKYQNWKYYRFRNDTQIGYITIYKIQARKSRSIQILDGYYTRLNINSKQHLELNLTIKADVKLMMSITRVRAATKAQMQQHKILYAETEIF